MTSIFWRPPMQHSDPTKLLLLAALACLATAVAAEEDRMESPFPQQQSAGDLLRYCAASRLTATGRERRSYCAGFVSGVEEAVRLLQGSGPALARICTPPDVSAAALARVYVKYGAGHKGELADPAAEMVLHALAQAYPCAAGR
jgi:hypothetical protein